MWGWIGKYPQLVQHSRSPHFQEAKPYDISSECSYDARKCASQSFIFTFRHFVISIKRTKWIKCVFFLLKGKEYVNVSYILPSVFFVLFCKDFWYVYVVLIFFFLSSSTCRVRNWALKFGVDLWEFGRQFTKMNEIRNVSVQLFFSHVASGSENFL